MWEGLRLISCPAPAKGQMFGCLRHKASKSQSREIERENGLPCQPRRAVVPRQIAPAQRQNAPERSPASIVSCGSVHLWVCDQWRQPRPMLARRSSHQTGRRRLEMERTEIATNISGIKPCEARRFVGELVPTALLVLAWLIICFLIFSLVDPYGVIGWPQIAAFNAVKPLQGANSRIYKPFALPQRRL